jgi:hypothetical protein
MRMDGNPARSRWRVCKGESNRKTDRPLWERPILPVSLIISGYSFVSSIVFEINSSNFQREILEGGENALQGRRRKC